MNETALRQSISNEGKRKITQDLVKNSMYNVAVKMLQAKHTPFDFCRLMISRLSEQCSLINSRVCVMFNIEMVDILIEDFGVSADQIVFVSDHQIKTSTVSKLYGISKIHHLSYDRTAPQNRRISIVPLIMNGFDVILMNPPYQGDVNEKEGSKAKGSRSVIWDKFVRLAIDLLNDGGCMAVVHPPKWRKPEDDLYEVISSYEVPYLELHTKSDGLKIFGAGTGYDWYVLVKQPPQNPTTLIDLAGKERSIDLRSLPFLPGEQLDVVLDLLPGPEDRRSEVIYSYSEYETRKNWMNDTETEEFCHPCVYATNKNGIRLAWSSKRSVHFGMSKLIFGDNGSICNAIVDWKGDYGLTQHAIGIPISSEEEGIQMKSALESEAFNDLIQNALRFNQFMIDWRIFRNLKADFWHAFL